MTTLSTFLFISAFFLLVCLRLFLRLPHSVARKYAPPQSSFATSFIKLYVLCTAGFGIVAFYLLIYYPGKPFVYIFLLVLALCLGMIATLYLRKIVNKNKQ